jgi:hypothetical protein
MVATLRCLQVNLNWIFELKRRVKNQNSHASSYLMLHTSHEKFYLPIYLIDKGIHIVVRRSSLHGPILKSRSSRRWAPRVPRLTVHSIVSWFLGFHTSMYFLPNCLMSIRCTHSSNLNLNIRISKNKCNICKHNKKFDETTSMAILRRSRTFLEWFRSTPYPWY